MRIIYNVKRCYAVRLKFGDKFLTLLIKFVLEEEASIASTMKGNIILYCRKFLVFAVVVIT